MKFPFGHPLDSSIIGLFASYGATRFLASQLWSVSRTDP
jgi:hypothetical protein